MVEEPERAFVGPEDALPAEVFVWAACANNEEAECAVDGEPVVAAEQPPDIALEKSAGNKGVECAGDGKLVVEELERAFVGPEDSLPAEVKSAPAKPLAILGPQNMPAGPAERPVVRRRRRTKSKSQFFATKRLAGAELGAADEERRSGGVSDEMAAPARLTSLSRGAHSALEAMGTHLSTFSLSVTQVSEIWSRAGASQEGQLAHESQESV